MSIREVNPSSSEVNAIAEAQLQEELRSLFIVDTQTYLQKYIQLAQNLQPETWKTDIQELYRCIHTIKGGAVTVAAEAVLRLSTALEDLLSDLRYLEVAPLLSDHHLQQVLREGGELLTGVLMQEAADLKPILNRVQTLYQEVRERYLSQWNPLRQLHQDFAEQGLDLVVLDLQIALERMPDELPVSAATIETARQTLTQLHQIGSELELESGWNDLLHQAEAWLTDPIQEGWRSQWFLLFQALKICAKQGGSPVALDSVSFDVTPLDAVLLDSVSLNSVSLNSVPLDTTSFDRDADRNAEMAIDTTANDTSINDSISDLTISDLPVAIDLDTADLDGNSWDDSSFVAFDSSEFPDGDKFLESEFSESEFSENRLDSIDSDSFSFGSVQDWLDLPVSNEALFAEIKSAEPATLEPLTADISEQSSSDSEPQSASNAIAVPASEPLPPEPLPSEPLPDPAKVQIPVSLEKLDRSAQYLIETLLSLRSAQGFYQTLQNQITQLVTLSQEGVQSITRLRQIQDDYALLDLQSKQSPQGLTPERYRQGYTVINRLLETSLRLSEIGAEAGKVTEQITENLRSVDSSVLKLQNTIEDSRLVSFQSLGIRARAILRDLVTRYHKPARLIILGEQTELDVSTARALEPALLHLIRNAYDHGLESPDERVAQGKPEQGTIVLSLRRRGNVFSLEFQDDGRGIDAEKVRSRAAAANFPLTQTATAKDLLKVICQPGFSSETAVNEISGRGVGMDVVAAQVTRLGGQLSLETATGRGTTFQIQFPAPRLLVPCVLVRAGDCTFAIPEDDIRTITLLGNLDAVQNGAQNHPENKPENGNVPINPKATDYSWTVQNGDRFTPALDLLGYWQPHGGGRSLTETAVCLFIHQNKQNASDAQEGIWLLADELLEQSELVINLLPSPLVVPPGLLGVSLQVNGSLVPVLEAQALAEWLLNLPAEQAETAIEAADSDNLTTGRAVQTILVVDDAALMRRRLEGSLSANGYAIHTCSDGQEAWNWLQEHPHPSLILTDIEMPNMDGFTLIDRCRQNGIKVPILVISSRLSEEWSNEARRLGASDYLTKGFATVELVSKVNRLLSKVNSVS